MLRAFCWPLFGMMPVRQVYRITWSVPTVRSVFFSLNKLVCFLQKAFVAPVLLRFYSNHFNHFCGDFWGVFLQSKRIDLLLLRCELIKTLKSWRAKLFVYFNYIELLVRRLVKVRCWTLESFSYKHIKRAIKCYITQNIVNSLSTVLEILILSRDGLNFFFFNFSYEN